MPRLVFLVLAFLSAWCADVVPRPLRCDKDSHEGLRRLWGSIRSRNPADLSLSRQVFSRWSDVAADQLRQVVIWIFALPGKTVAQVEMDLAEQYFDILRQVGLSDTCRASVESLILQESAASDIKDAPHGFCVIPYIAAVLRLIQTEHSKFYLDHLCSLLRTEGGLHWALMVLSFPYDVTNVVEQLLRTLEANQARACAIRSPSAFFGPSGPSGPSGAPKARPAPVAPFRTALLSSHIWAWDSLMASREAAIVEGLAWEGLILGYTLADRFEVAKENCFKIQEFMGMGSRPLCQGGHWITVMMDLCTDEGIGTENGCSIHAVKRHLRAAREEVPFFREADLLICSYPYALCPIVGTYEGFEGTAVMVAVKGAGSLTEYADASLVPWLLSIYRRWLSEDSGGLRQVTFADRMDPVLVEAAFGESAEWVDFGARYALELAGGIRCDLRDLRPTRSGSLLIWRLQAAFPAQEALASQLLLTTTLREMTVWSIDVMEETWQFRYAELHKYSAVLQIPWDFALVSFLELLVLGIPVLLPGRRFMQNFITTIYWSRQNISAWKETWKQRFIQLIPEPWEGFGFGKSNKTMGIDVRSKTSMLDQVSFWWKYTEFERHRWVKHFSSVTELATILQTIDTGVLCSKLAKETKAKLARSLAVHRRIIHMVRKRRVSPKEGLVLPLLSSGISPELVGVVYCRLRSTLLGQSDERQFCLLTTKPLASCMF